MGPIQVGCGSISTSKMAVLTEAKARLYFACLRRHAASLRRPAESRLRVWKVTATALA